MASPTPPELARVGAGIRIKRVERYVYDPYWHAHISVSHGTSQLPVSIPATGPGAAGATFPNVQPQVETVEVTVFGTLTPGEQYGSNLPRP